MTETGPESTASAREVETGSPGDTRAVARRFAADLSPGDVLLLFGEMGAGKTCFVQGLAEGLGLDPRRVHSPSFIMVNRYGACMDTNLVLPAGTDRCHVEYHWFFSREVAEDQSFVEDALVRSDRVQVEDVALCARVQQGLRSQAYDLGVYAQTETSMLQFHQLLHRDLKRG